MLRPGPVLRYRSSSRSRGGHTDTRVSVQHGRASVCLGHERTHNPPGGKFAPNLAGSNSRASATTLPSALAGVYYTQYSWQKRHGRLQFYLLIVHSIIFLLTSPVSSSSCVSTFFSFFPVLMFVFARKDYRRTIEGLWKEKD